MDSAPPSTKLPPRPQDYGFDHRSQGLQPASPAMVLCIPPSGARGRSFVEEFERERMLPLSETAHSLASDKGSFLFPAGFSASASGQRRPASQPSWGCRFSFNKGNIVKNDLGLHVFPIHQALRNLHDSVCNHLIRLANDGQPRKGYIGYAGTVICNYLYIVRDGEPQLLRLFKISMAYKSVPKKASTPGYISKML